LKTQTFDIKTCHGENWNSSNNKSSGDDVETKGSQRPLISSQETITEVTMLFNWNDIDNEDDLLEELVDGLTYLERDELLSFVAGIIYESGFSIREVTDRINEIDESVYEY
jgi:hypothetical protein